MTRALASGVVLAVVAAGGATAWWLSSPTGRAPARVAVAVDTATVVRTTLTTTTQLSGTLGYAGSTVVDAQLGGTLTALPAAGAIIRRGQAVYEVDGVRVCLFYGARPAWRPFQAGMTPGPDVLELEQNLASLGYGTSMTVDPEFTWSTGQAIRAWQLATGQQVTGSIELGRVAFTPTAVRIASTTAPLGATLQPGMPVLSTSSPDPVVSVPVPATQTYLVRVGDRVTVTVPSGATSTGRVTSISSVASSDQASGNGNGNGNGNGPPIASVPAQVTLDNRSVAAHLDQAPVTVTVTDRQVDGVLAVPVTALVALSGGGYAVWLEPPAAPRRLVAVSTGLFTDTLVQVTSTQLHTGDQVEVPAQ